MTKELRVLMLEDSAADAELNEYALQKGGISFISKRVMTKEEFEEALSSFEPDVILSDYDLPSFDGISAMLMAQRECPEIPFIFVTGIMGEEMAIETLKRGATDYVLKNRLSRLVPAVQRALDEVDARNERQRAEKALRESERRYRAVFESTGTAMCVIDEDTVISFVNKQFELMSGYKAEEIEGRMKILEFLAAGDVELKNFEQYHRETLREGSNHSAPFSCSVYARNRSVLNALVTMGVLPGTQNCVVSINDVTREKAYENELSDRAERLEHFLTVASHELRHPITIIKGYTMMLSTKKGQIPEKTLTDIYSSMDDAANRLTRIVQELMDVSRFDTIDVLTERRSCELGSLVMEAVDEMSARGAANEFVVDIPKNSAAAEVDPEKFIQLMLILLDNAVNYSPYGSTVEVRANRESGPLSVSVLDSGPGVPEEDRERIFERFYQVADVMHHSTPGLGIGLYVAQRIAVAHGGKIFYEPRDGGGSIFTVTLES